MPYSLRNELARRRAEGDLEQGRTVRLARQADAALVAQFLAAFRDEMGRSSPTEEVLLDAVQRVLGAGGEFLLVFADDGSPAGVAQLRYRWCVWTNRRDCWLEDLFVSEQFRHRGLGRALLEGAIARARSGGCARFELDVLEDNEEAISLYAYLGLSDTPKGDVPSRLMGMRLENR